MRCPEYKIEINIQGPINEHDKSIKEEISGEDDIQHESDYNASSQRLSFIGPIDKTKMAGPRIAFMNEN